MSPYLRWGMALALLPLAGCVGTPVAEPGAQPPPAAPNAATVPSPMPLAAQDRLFIAQAAQSNLAEIQEAELALRRSRSPRIRDFAHQMIQDHTQLNQQLGAVATSLGGGLPSQPNEHQMLQMKLLQGMGGRAFNRRYVADQITAHQQAITAFQTEIQAGQNPQLVQLAQQAMPILQQHLGMAQSLEAGMSRHMR